MSLWLLEGSLAVLFVILLLPVAIVPLVGRVYRSHGRFAGWPALLSLASLGMACAVAAFTLFPLPNDLNCDLRSNFDYWSLQPLTSTRRWGSILASDGPVGLLTSGAFLQVAFNVLLFVPVGFLVHQQTKWHPTRVVAAGVALSMAVELTQGTALFGAFECPYRVAEFDDLVWNTGGTLLGALVSVVALRWFAFTSPQRSQDSGPPTLRRRLAAAVLDLVVLSLVAVAIQIVVNIVVVIAAGRESLSDHTVAAARQILSSAAAAVVVGLVVPALRSDAATPGQATVLLRPDTEAGSVLRAQLVRRWLVRWLPLAVLPGTWGLLVWVVDALATWRHPSHRSLAGRFSSTHLEAVPAPA